MITSKQNALIKKIRSLKDKKFRDSLNLYIVEGIKMVKEAVISAQNIESIVCSEKMAERVKEFYSNYEIASDEVIEYASSEVTPQGVIAVVVKPQNQLASPRGNSLFLDGVSDPANVGAIIRTAASSGFNDIYLSASADAYSPKAVRASMSGIFKVKTHIAEKEKLLSMINIPLVVADMSGVDAKSFKPTTPVCLVIGSEANGVSEQVRKMASHTVSLKMDNDMESLNASVSASILMYAISGKI